MSLAGLRKAGRHVLPNEFGHTYSCAEYYSRMWAGSIPRSSLDLFISPPRNRNEQEQLVANASHDFADWASGICIRHWKQHLHRPPRMMVWRVCGKKRVPRPKEAWEHLSDYFHFKDTGAVVGFLKRNLFLVDFLLETRKQIDYYFGAEVSSSLELFVDPEDEHSAPKLFALILTKLSSDDASRRLDRLDQGWWLNQPYEVKHLMNIDVEYVNASV